MRIKFSKTVKKLRYLGGFTFNDGDEQEVSDAEGKRLCADFPANFTVVKAEVRESSQKAAKPSKDKSMGDKPNK